MFQRLIYISNSGTLDVSLFLINYNTGLKLDIQKIMIMASDPTTCW